MTPTAVRVLVVDDHDLFREGLVAILSMSRDVDVVGQASTGGQALALAEDLRPDVVLMDIAMPDMTGIEATRALMSRRPGTAVAMITMMDDPGTRSEARSAGARGYLLKGASRREIIETVLRIGTGTGTGIESRPPLA